MKFIPCEAGFWLVAESHVEERQLEQVKGIKFEAENRFATRRVIKGKVGPLLSLFLVGKEGWKK